MGSFKTNYFGFVREKQQCRISFTGRISEIIHATNASYLAKKRCISSTAPCHINTSPWVKQLWHEVSYSPRYNVEVKNEWRYTSSPPVCRHRLTVTNLRFNDLTTSTKKCQVKKYSKLLHLIYILVNILNLDLIKLLSRTHQINTSKMCEP
jgi:hypothetical protein